MSHYEHHHSEEKKSINFWGPVIGALVVWLIVLIIETNLDGKHHSDNTTHSSHTEQSIDSNTQHH